MVSAAGFVIAATGVSSLFPDWLSNSCIETLTDISSNGTFTCFGANKLPTILLAPTTQSFIDGVDSWVAFACAQSACSDAVVESLFTQVTTKCATDLNHIGVAGLVIEDIGSYRQNWYELGRGLLCLKDCTSNTSCISTALQAVADHANVTLSINSFWSAVSTLVGPGKDVLKNIACTSCARGAYDLIRPFLSFFELVAVDISLGSLCGATFFNGTCPAETIQPTNTTSPVPSATPSASVTTSVSATPSAVTTTSATTSASATTNATTTASASISTTTSAATSASTTRSPCMGATPNTSATSPTTTSVSTTTSATTTTSASAITNAVTNVIAKTSANGAISLKTGLFGSTAAIILAIALAS